MCLIAAQQVLPMDFRSFSDRALREVVAWIVESGLAEAPIAELVDGTVRRLVAAGVPVYRMRIAFRVLHPLFDGMGITWSEEAGAELSFNSLPDHEGSSFRTSPFYFMLANGVMEMRRRLDRGEDVDRFPILAELKQEGATDYFASLVGFGRAAPHPATHGGLASSWATRRPEGFGDDDVAAIRWLLRPLALALRVAIKDQITRTALDTFHGPLVGERILSGAIKRGSGERLSAALWYSDLRNSTALADALPVEAFLELLNAYFDCAAGAVVAQGGEVLDIIGDAILAIFPAGDGADGVEACAQALAAAAGARERLAAMRRDGAARAEAIEFGIGVHFGDVVFGNAGTAARLKFGVIGRAVNEVARTAATAKALARPVVVSDEVARRSALAFEDLGRHHLRGIPTARRLWALASLG
jgi:adenylate cyclase